MTCSMIAMSMSIRIPVSLSFSLFSMMIMLLSIQRWQDYSRLRRNWIEWRFSKGRLVSVGSY
ncbi:hypothetical protein BO85DRAFT_244293 [Aspergillus piperis CBS 112811]|uniref:Uncharacterized protein n=1 Tax=Aspergillus piperis CBS 112811 TaxID=1448313 RepID=A0A8G1RA38_9EURO|nr:hypothetical protein BO85DRAFT_244293 [Aspergillus piperis CBS 112811]RAH59530.1 hypothetical protein BO85DRAFT_244293 [Aspergillus piperis CBS 112811]